MLINSFILKKTLYSKSLGGNEFPLPDGSGPSECDPNSANHCCSKWGTLIHKLALIFETCY